MRLFSTLLLALAALLPLEAQDWCLNWIRAPWGNATDQVWFSRSFVLKDVPRQAHVEMASSGHFQLYINDINVTTRLLEPFFQRNADTLHVVSYDVLPFLRRGSNTVRVWFSPTCDSPKQLSFSLMAESGRRMFALHSDSRWLCAWAHAQTFADGHEEVDGRFHITRPTPTATWQPAEEVKNVKSSFRMPHFIGHLPYEARYYTCYMTEPDTTQSNKCVYRCGLDFKGRVRVSLTGMRSGDTLRVNRHVYVCNGKDGEQAFQRFAIGASGTVSLAGPPRFSAKNVELVEACAIRALSVQGAKPYPAGHSAVYDDEPITYIDEESDD